MIAVALRNVLKEHLALLAILVTCGSFSCQTRKSQDIDAPNRAEHRLEVSPDDRNTILRMLGLNEKDLLTGLRVFVELSGGRYPGKLDAKTTINEMARLCKNGKTSKDEMKAKAQDVFFAGAYYEKLVREKKDVAYHGDKVTVEDSSNVLMRWKISDGRYRVIWTDLSAETVTAERLAELEKGGL